MLIVCMCCSLFISGCGVLDFFSDKESPPPIKKIENPVTNKEEDEKVKGIIKEYLKKVYTIPLEELTERSTNGNIPESLFEFISPDVLDIGLNSINIGIHLPRIIHYGGFNTVSFEILRDDEENERIDVDLYEYDQSKDRFKYFVKVYTKARVLEDEIFFSHYTLNEENNFFQKQTEVSDESYNAIKLVFEYAVTMDKINDEYKIFDIKEANIISLNDKRISIYNNSFAEMIPYLEEGIEKERNILKFEKEIIEKFILNMFSQKSENIQVLNEKWIMEDENEYIDLFDKLKIGDNEDQRIVINGEDFKERYKVGDMPIREAIQSFDINSLNIKIEIQPKYNENQKYYSADISVGAYETGLSNKDLKQYKFKYEFYLVEYEGINYIKHMKLLEFSRIR